MIILISCGHQTTREFRPDSPSIEDLLGSVDDFTKSLALRRFSFVLLSFAHLSFVIVEFLNERPLSVGLIRRRRRLHAQSVIAGRRIRSLAV